MGELKQVFRADDGQIFDTKQEALDHMRLPKIKEALNEIASNNAELVQWLVDNKELIVDSFNVGTIRRVTKSERKKLVKAMEAVKEHCSDLKPCQFVVENADALVDSFRWPSVKRMDETEKNAAIKTTLAAAADENGDEIADWVIGNKDKILEAYKAGIVKRTVSPKTKEALAAYRAKVAAEKEAANG